MLTTNRFKEAFFSISTRARRWIWLCSSATFDPSAGSGLPSRSAEPFRCSNLEVCGSDLSKINDSRVIPSTFETNNGISLTIGAVEPSQLYLSVISVISEELSDLSELQRDWHCAADRFVAPALPTVDPNEQVIPDETAYAANCQFMPYRETHPLRMESSLGVQGSNDSPSELDNEIAMRGVLTPTGKMIPLRNLFFL